MEFIKHKSEELSDAEAEQIVEYITELRTFRASCLLAPEARKALWLLLDNIEAVDISSLIKGLGPYLRQALDNEKRKLELGCSLYDGTWEDWLVALTSGELVLERPPLITMPEETNRFFAQEVAYAQACKELSPDITVVVDNDGGAK